MRLALALAAAFLCPGTNANTDAAATPAPPPTDAELSALREELQPLDFDIPPTYSAAVNTYLDFYGLRTPHEHRFGTFRSGRYVLAAHLVRPQKAKGTVILMHGFFDHVGTLSAAVQHLLAQGFAVAAYDEPGHGLSSGPRASIDDFAEYTGIFTDFVQLCREDMPSPHHVLAHSTGAAVVADHLLQSRQDQLGKIVLVAPLIRSAFWEVSTSVTPVMEVFVDDLPRVFRDNSSDEQFLELVRQDPLQPRHTSIAWFNALVSWNTRAQAYQPSPRTVAIIQGDADSVVDWQYNLNFLTTKFPNARVEIIETGRHQLLNEGPPLRARVFRIVDEIFAPKLEH